MPRRYPVMRNFIILANIAVFLYLLWQGESVIMAFIDKYAFLGSKLAENPVGNSYTFITYQFIHGGVGHILGNMWYLFVFAPHVESKLGMGRFLFFYLFSGMISCMVQAVAVPAHSIPLVGASGSVAGVLGFYAAMFPGAKILTWVPIGLFGWFVKIPAIAFLLFWFFFQFLLAYLSQTSGVVAGGVAWWAHLGGFVFGLLFGLSIR